MDVVLNWLAQGVIVTLAAAAALHLIPASRPHVRYGFIWAAYLSLLVLPAVAPLLTLAPEARGELAPALAAPLVAVPTAWWTSVTLAIGLWIVWFGVHAVVLGRGLLAAEGAKRHWQACPRNLLTSLPHWSRVSATGRATRVVLSDRVRLAGVLGCGAPVIAIAPRLLDELSAADLDRVLVHEWAHLQRRDDVAHVLQRVARAVVGWHPGAWWLERQLELERELACDEIAVRVTGSVKRYAECLVTIASLNRPQDRTMAIVAVVSRSRLQQRIERILSVASVPTVHSWRRLVIGCAIGLATCVWGASNVRVVTSTVESAILTATAPDTRTVEHRTPPAAQSSEPATSMWNVVTVRHRRPAARVSSAVQEAGVARRPTLLAGRDYASIDAGDTHPAEELSTTPIASLPVLSMVDGSGAMALPVIRAVSQPSTNADADVSAPGLTQPAANLSKGWARAADAGLAVGRASQDAGVATAGFFRRFGKRVAGSF